MHICELMGYAPVPNFMVLALAGTRCNIGKMLRVLLRARKSTKMKACLVNPQIVAQLTRLLEVAMSRSRILCKTHSGP